MCNEIGFSTSGLDIDEKRLPENSFFTELEWPCRNDPDPGCTETRRMLFITDHRGMDFLYDMKDVGASYENYAQVQRAVGEVFDRILIDISSQT
jgi:hypothetical protein